MTARFVTFSGREQGVSVAELWVPDAKLATPARLTDNPLEAVDG